MPFSLTSVIDYLDSQPEHLVMAMVQQAYESSNERGMFNEKLIPYSDLHMLGYKGFKRMLLSLHAANPDFVEQHRAELHSIVRKLKEM